MFFWLIRPRGVNRKLLRALKSFFISFVQNFSQKYGGDMGVTFHKFPDGGWITPHHPHICAEWKTLNLVKAINHLGRISILNKIQLYVILKGLVTIFLTYLFFYQLKGLKKWNSMVQKPFRGNSLSQFYKFLNISVDDVMVNRKALGKTWKTEIFSWFFLFQQIPVNWFSLLLFNNFLVIKDFPGDLRPFTQKILKILILSSSPI